MLNNKNKFAKIAFPVIGIGSFLWFLVRVIPKPSRAAYPCMRIAAPVASTFVLWLLGVFASSYFFRRAYRCARSAKYLFAVGCIVAGCVAGVLTILAEHSPGTARPSATFVVSNNPVGTARGVNPGRVVWAHDSSAAAWPGSGNGYWWECDNTDQDKVDTMLARSLAALCGTTTPSSSWDTLFRYFNDTRGNGPYGYRAGEKIVIKTNFSSTNPLPGWCSLDTATYSLKDKMNFCNTSPQLVRALLRQLVYDVGVEQSDIAVGDPVCYYPNEYYDSCHTEFPDVQYLDCKGKFGRTKAAFSSVPMYWSCRPGSVAQDYIEKHLAQASYLVNCAVLKSHMGNGITLCAKNHYGSFVRLPVDSGYYDLHQSLAFMTPGSGQYRSLVDIMGHAHLGGKTVLYLVDGLYSQNHNTDTAPRKWHVAPFNDGWSASIFTSQDPVAIESVLRDLYLLDDDPAHYPAMSGADDYLFEAAQADDPPSGTYYDPDHAAPTTRLRSLGVTEHWNNDVDRQYSGNLGTGDGIELVFLKDAGSGISNRPGLRTGVPGFAIRAVTGERRVAVRVPAGCTFTVSLYNMAGLSVRSITRTCRTAGTVDIGLNATDGTGSEPLAPGHYTAVLSRAGTHGLETTAFCTVLILGMR